MIGRNQYGNMIEIESDFLWSLYWGNQYSKETIGKLLNCSRPVIDKRMIKYNIPSRNLSESHLGLPSYRKGTKLTKEHKERISKANKGRIAWNKGKKLSLDSRRKISKSKKGKRLSLETEFKIGNIPWNKGIPCSEETKMKISKAKEGKFKGVNSPHWNGGITSKNGLIRGSAETNKWREQIHKRDNYTCQLCYYRGGELNVHHIKSFADYPELRFNVNNGITLCKTCHQKVHKIRGRITITPIKDI